MYNLMKWIVIILVIAVIGKAHAKENKIEKFITGSFNISGNRINVTLKNNGDKDVIVSAFFEGLRDAAVYLKDKQSPVIQNEKLINFSIINTNNVWIRIRKENKDFPQAGSMFYYQYEIISEDMLELVKKNDQKSIIFVVNCRIASLEENQLSDPLITKIQLTYEN